MSSDHINSPPNSPSSPHNLHPLQMTPMRSKALRNLQLTRLIPVSNIRQIRRPPNNLRYQRRLHLPAEHELFQRLRHRKPRRELTHQIHPPRRVTDVALVTDVGLELDTATFEYEGFYLLVSIGVGEGGEVFGVGDGNEGGEGFGSAVVDAEGSSIDLDGVVAAVVRPSGDGGHAGEASYSFIGGFLK